MCNFRGGQEGILPSDNIFCLFHAGQAEIKNFFFIQFQLAWHSISTNKKS